MKTFPRSISTAAAVAALLGCSMTAGAAAAGSSQVWFGADGGEVTVAELLRPDGAGPFPAVVMLRGCEAGAPTSRAVQGEASALVAEGFVVLVVHSDCATQGAATITSRSAEATAAYRYLAGSGLVQPDRIGLVGWSDGATAALVAVDRDTGTGYHAAVAAGPACALAGASGWQPAAPVVIVQDDRDAGYRDWSCHQRIAEAQARAVAGGSVSLVVQSHRGAPASVGRRDAEAVRQIGTLLQG